MAVDWGEAQQDFSRSTPLRGPDAPTPEYVPPQKGSFARGSRVFAGLTAICAGACIVAVLLIAQSVRSDETGFEVEEQGTISIVADSATCEIDVGIPVANRADEAVTISEVKLNLRQGEGSKPFRLIRADSIEPLVFQSDESRTLRSRFDFGECEADASLFNAQRLVIVFTGEDGVADESELFDIELVSEDDS